MLSDQESQELMSKFVDLRKKAKETNSKKDILEFKKHENICIEKFYYLITMRTSKYKKFNNYDDLNQEGQEALLKAMSTFDKKKSPSFFYWAHKYIDTRISRKANQHTAIRFPLKYAKELPPHKETIMPIVADNERVPDLEYEKVESVNLVNGGLKFLSDKQRNIIEMLFGLESPKISTAKICKMLNISRSECEKIIKESLLIMRTNIKV